MSFPQHTVSGLQSSSTAHLYSQKVSSFIPCDSMSVWRSSLSFTAKEQDRRILHFQITHVFNNFQKKITQILTATIC